MPARQRLSADERGMALAWLQSGIGLREIGRRLQVSHSVIHRLQERFHATGTTIERSRSGRPRATTRQEDRYVGLSALRERSVTAETLRGQLRMATHTNVSSQTIRRRLREQGLQSRRPAIRIRLTADHRRRRLAWCRAHVRWTRAQWARVLFTDESRFTMSFHDGRNRVWRRGGERFMDATIQEHDRYGGGSVMVWGGINFRSRTPLYRVEGNLNGVGYRDRILGPIALPVLNAVGPGAIYQHDNAPAHRARVVTDFLQQQQVDAMVWPALSPDLNPIEHLWDVLGRRIRANHPRPANLQRLFQFLQEEWEAVPQVTLQNLILSMRRRCQDCIAANGGHTRY